MKKSLVIALAVLLLLFTGCGNNIDTSKTEKTKISDKISSMEVLIDNNLIKITDKLTFENFKKMGFRPDESYEGVLEKKLSPSKSADNIINESFNIKTSDGKLVALSVVNLNKKKISVKDCTVYFIGTYASEEYDHSYTLPNNIKYNDNIKIIKERWGNPAVDLSSMNDGKMVQYIEKNKCTFTANLSKENNITSYSIILDNKFIFNQ